MIDPNEAPEGYRAVPGLTCDGCAFDVAMSIAACGKCNPGRRRDGVSVVFVRIGPVMATYFTPCDDMGAHV